MDIQVIAAGEKPVAPVVLERLGSLDPQAAELAALAEWSGRKSHGCRASQAATSYTGIC